MLVRSWHRSLSHLAALAALATSLHAGDERAFATSPGLGDPRAVPRGREFELTLDKPVDYGLQRNFRDVDLRVSLVAPSSATASISGFFFGTLAGSSGPVHSLWKARFVPREVGAWSYAWTFVHVPSGYRASGAGQFVCVPSNEPGFVKLQSGNPFQLVTEDGAAFFPIGTNENMDRSTIGFLEGGSSSGAFVSPITPVDEVYRTYADSGCNMIRFNGAFTCLATERTDPTPWDYNVDGGLILDMHMQKARQAGQRVFATLFSNYVHMSWALKPEERVYIKYFVARYATRADVLQVHNERLADRSWYEAVRTEIRAQDPYRHPVAATWYMTPNLPAEDACTSLDLVTPHVYNLEDPLTSDQFVADKAAVWRRYGKPVVMTELGNAGSGSGDTSAWTPESPIRWRIRAFTALMHQIGLLPWNGSGNAGPSRGTSGAPVNLYLGREERQYLQVVAWLARLGLRADSVPIPVRVSVSGARAFGLGGAHTALAYVHHSSDHQTTVSGASLTLDLVAGGRAFFFDPSTGALRGNAAVAAGTGRTVALPDFAVDLAVLVTDAPLSTPPVALVQITNPQWDGDLDNDGVPDYGPAQPPFGLAPLTLALDAGASHDADGGTLTFRWDFGDGTAPANGARVTHTYQRGNFVTRVTVTDDEGQAAVCGFAVRVNADARSNANDAPVSDPLVASVTIREGEPLILTPWAEDDELEGTGTAMHYVRYGEAAVHTTSALPPGATFGTRGAGWVDNLFWVPDFSQAGTYSISFRVQDTGGLQGAPRTVQVTVLEANTAPFLCSPAFNPQSGPGSPFTMSAQVSDMDGAADIDGVYGYFVYETGQYAGWARLTDQGNGEFRTAILPSLTPGGWTCYLLAVDKSRGYSFAVLPFRM